MATIRWVWKYIKPHLRKWIFASVLTVIVSGVVIVTPYISGRIVDEVIVAGNMDRLIPLLSIMVGIVIAKEALRYYYQIQYESISQDALYQIREELYQKLQELDFSFFNQTRTGDIMARMTGDTNAIRHGIAWTYYSILDNIVLFLSALVLMFTIDWRLTLALLSVTPFIVMLTVLLSKNARQAYYDIRQSFSRLNSMVEENIRGNKTVKVFANEDYEQEKFNKVNEYFKETNMASANISKTYLPAIEVFAGLMSVISIGFGGWLVINQKISIGNLVTFNSLVWMINMPMRNVGNFMNNIQNLYSSSLKIREMLAREPKIPIEEQKQEGEIRGAVEFRNVSFAFDDEPNTLVLDNITFQANPGEEIGILGETGSGKTTLINLISRFYDPTEGQVLIDGIDARDWNVIALRKNIAVIMQDAFVFSDTIQSNIAYGYPGARMEEIKRAAEISDSKEFIEKMPFDYETYLGEQGSGLSGGQKQRLSLARGLLKDPSILILDDTTSAVDMETEIKIQEGIDETSQHMTKFIIANRISSVKDADHIMVLSDGKIQEEGVHQELLAKKGSYYEIYKEQLGQNE
ncbi:MAG: ABC transporter ATP-binding protein/permease [Atopostipes sp.]|nr:ABC transporter ATP-binding protein/permease [Atopostipes sp.]